MTYRGSHIESRERYLAAYDEEEASRYDAWVASLTRADHDARLNDLNQHVEFVDGMSLLDAGAGTGALCLALAAMPAIRITALEPCAAMLAKLVAKPELGRITTRQGFCDHRDDRVHFKSGTFDVIASQQLVNCLFDPLAAFRNWHYWLKPSGCVVVTDGLFDRGDWTGRWESVVDTLPLSACRTLATVPYLLEETGFRVEFVGWMEETNALPSTRTKRYLVVAKKDKGCG